MDSAAALTELSTITRSAGVTDATDASANGAGEDGRVEIGRYAARLAAFERTVLPVAQRRLDDGGTRAKQLREWGEQLNTVLYWMDRHLTGDPRARTWPGDDLDQDVQAAMDSYDELEQKLITELAGALGEADLTKLVRSYHQAEQVAPTRPHPNLGYGGALGGLTFRLAGLIDDVRDGTESRPAGPVVGTEAAQALRELDGDADRAAGDAAIGSESKPTPADS
jgi:hypothetical protein